MAGSSFSPVATELEELDALNEKVLERRTHLRACIVNVRTERDDAEALPEIVARHRRQARAAG